MKRFAVLSGLAGLTLFSLLVAYSGFDDVADAIGKAGWAVGLIVLARAAAVSVAGLGWRFLFPIGPGGIPARICVLLRFVREGINQLLPVGQVGGDVIGGRLATFWGAPGAVAGAATVADVALQAATQFVFAITGLSLLVWLKGDSEIVRVAAGGLCLAALLLVAFFALQLRYGSRWIGPLLRRIARGRDWAVLGIVERLFSQLGTVYASRGRVVLSALVHLAGWVIGATEVFIALRFMGHPVSFAEAVVIESLGQAVKGAAFAVPGGLGVMEGGFVALCGLFGIPAGTALAMSIVKRVPDLVLGLPSLAAWQIIEGRRALRGREPLGATPTLAECRG